MWLLKNTTISGYTDSPEPDRDDYERRARAAESQQEAVRLYREYEKARKAWCKVYTLRGHWNPISAAAFARRNGVTSAVEVEHTTSDLNGKGYSSIDGRWIVTPDDVAHARPVSERDQEDYAQQVDSDVWENA